MRSTNNLLPRWLLLTCIMAAACPRVHAAATMRPISTTGYNRDVIIENTASGPPYNAAAQNFNAGEQRAFYQTNLSGTTRGLPLTGQFTNANDGTIYQLQPYTANNALVFSTDTGLTSGTLFLSTPRAYDSIAVIANSGNGDSIGSATLTIHFNDGSTFVTNYYAPDWFNNNNALYSIALQGFQRILLAGGTDGGTTNPRFYQTTLALAGIPGATNKLISSITFAKVPTANTTGIYAVSGATNSSQSNVTFTVAVVTNLPATGVQTKAATLNGQVLSIGNDAPLITMYYGPTDGGTNAGAWANSTNFNWQTGSFSLPITGLSVSTTYYFAVKAANAAGTSWGTPSRSFTTLAPTLPAVANLPASALTVSSAALNGQVLSTGGDTPSVTIYYGTSNGGTNPAAWANSVSDGLQAGAYGHGAFGLASNTTYFYTAKAANLAGTSWATPSVSFTTLTTNPVAPTVAILTQHNDNSRTGDNLNETVLNAGNVNTNTFGFIYSRPVDDQVYAQPLVMTNVTIPGKGTHNVLYIATVNDSVYAYDADDPSVVTPYWQTNYLGTFGGTNVVAPRNSDMTGACGGNYQDFSGAFGIVGTPVIDPTTKTMYFVARTKETVSGVVTNFVQRLYAIDITTGTNRLAPAVISGSYGGVTFDPQKNNQRTALTLAGGNVYMGWSSHCDWGPYHGWVMAFNATTLAPVAVYADTTTGSNGGIWMSGQGPAADTNGNVFVSTGNGTVGSTGNPGDTTNRAMSFLKLNGSTLNIMSWFTPYNYNYLNGGDWDLGAGGLMLIPGTSLAIGGGKSSTTVPATLYVVNRDTMGNVSTGSSDTNIVQAIPVTPTGIGVNHIHGAPVWWDGPDGSYTYVWGESDRLHQYKFDRVNGVFSLPAYSQSPTPAWVNGMTGGMLSISGNSSNAGTGILWASHQYTGDANQAVRPGIVHAYDAQNVTNELWNSEQYSVRDSVGKYAKFVPPTVANSKVYVATFSGRVNVYGILPSTAPLIYQPPQNTVRYAGDHVTLTVAAGGKTPLFYQWMTNGNQAIPGATNASYALNSAQFSDAGTYTCRITNSLGSTNTPGAVLTIVPTPTVSYAQVVMADNPIAYWRLDETNGSTVAHDSWGGHDGQYNSVNLQQPGYSANDPNTSAQFGTLAASDSYVGNITGIDFSTFTGSSTFSLEAWVNGQGFAQTSGAGIITYGYGSGGEQFNLDNGNGGKFRLSIRDAINIAHNANGSIAPGNTWQHLVGVCDEPNGVMHLYVNGVDNADAAISGGIQMGTSPISIGARQAGFGTTYTLNFQGLIDEVAIYPYALSPAQVLNHYNAGLNPVVTLYVQRSGGNVILTWSPGTLQSAPAVTGPYSDISSATAPYVVPASGTQQYYRVRVQ